MNDTCVCKIVEGEDYYNINDDCPIHSYKNNPLSIHNITTVKTDKESFDLTQIPYHSLTRIGQVFKEGEVKYGRGNWKLGCHNIEYQLERANHAIKHLLIYIHLLETGEYLGEIKRLNEILVDTEDDLAKVAWFCVTQMEIERIEHAE